MAFRARKGFAFVSFSALFALAACGDEASSPSPATLPQVPPNTLAIDCGPFESFSAEAACEQFARVSCDFEARCDPRNRGGWGGDCDGRLKQNCLKLLAAPSFGYTPAYIAARAAVLASAGCAGQDRTEEVTFSCFDGKGSYSTGTPCLDSSQCQSGVCLSKNGGSCGVCSDPQSQEGLSCEFSCPGGLECVEGKCVAFAAGSACNSPYQCPTGLGCVDGKCAPLLAEGQACTPLSENDRGPCQPGFYCTGSCKVDSNFALDCSPGVCKPQGAVGAACTVTEEHPFSDECLPWLDCVRSACSEPVVAPGTPCVLQDDCSHLAGLYCENGACKQLPLAQEGQPCQDFSPPYQSCSPELVCVQKVCVKPFQDGQACDSSSRCLLGSECTGGVCKPTVLAETCEPQGAGGAGGAGGASGGGGSGNEGGEGGAAGMSGASGQGGSVSATCATQEECASFKTAPGQGAEPPAPSGGGATDGPAPLLHAVSRWFLGETDRQGTPDPDAWKAFGFDVDGWSSTPQQGFHCLPAAGAKASDIRMDGDKGIDNAFGKGFVNGILATLVSDASGEFSLTATEGKSTVLLDLGALGSASNYASTPSQWFHVAGDGLTPESDWSSYEWHPFADKVESSASSKTKFPGAYMSGDVWVSGEIPALEMPFDLQGLAMHFAVKKARLMLNVKDRTRGVDGVLAGVVPTEALVTSMVKLAGNFGSAFCDEQSAPLQGIIEAIRQTSDILVDGTQDPTRVCDGISLGVGFETRASKLGAVVPAQQIIDPCL